MAVKGEAGNERLQQIAEITANVVTLTSKFQHKWRQGTKEKQKKMHR